MTVIQWYLEHSLQRWLRDNRIVPFPLFSLQDPSGPLLMVSAPSMYLPPRFPPFAVLLCAGSGGHAQAKVIGLNSLCVPLSHYLFLTTFLFFELLSSVACRPSLSVPLLLSLRPDLSVEQTVVCVLLFIGRRSLSPKRPGGEEVRREGGDCSVICNQSLLSETHTPPGLLIHFLCLVKRFLDNK